jgi:hypothetical protein
MSPPIVSSIVLFCFLVFLLFLSLLYENSRMNLSSKSFWADKNLGTAIGSLSNNINYNYENIILFIVGSGWREGEREGKPKVVLVLTCSFQSSLNCLK